MTSTIVRVLLAFCAVVAVVAGSARPAGAQEAPLRMVFLNSDPMDGTAVYDSLGEVLEASNDLELIDPGDFLSAAGAEGIGLETFRDGDKREQYASTFKRMLAGAGAESVLVLDVFGGGHTMQLVVIGPRGHELGDIRQRISGSRPSQAESVEALKKVFKVLVPEVRSFREEEARRKEKQADVDLLGQKDDQEVSKSEAIKQRVIQEHRREHANLETGLTPNVGVVFGSRSLVLDTAADYDLDHSSPYVGFGAEIDAIFALLDGDTAAIGATLFGAYAPFTTVFPNANGQSVELPSSFSDVRLDLNYLKGVGRDIVVKGFVGGEARTIAIDQNQAYTGNSYINLRAGAGLVYQFGALAELRLNAAALPILSGDLSGDTMGKPDFGLGFGGGARLDVTALGDFRASVGYQFDYYSLTYPEPNLADLGGESAATTDIFHLARVTVGYGF